MTDLERLLAPGTLLRCIDAKVRKVALGAETSDFEKAQAGIIEVMEIVTVRETMEYEPFGGAWAVRLVEIERGIEGIRRYRALKVYALDRPFFLDRFVIVRESGGARPDGQIPKETERA